MNKTIKHLSLVTLLLVTACASRVQSPSVVTTPAVTTKSVAVTPAATVVAMKAANQLTGWSINGKIGIRTNKDSISANLKWQQFRRSYTIALLAPIGTQSLTLRGSPGRVTLIGANGKTATSNSPESLLAQQTGWRLPISNMYYWVRGLPVPGASGVKRYDQQNRLVQLQQSGWFIQYSDYQTQNGVDLPTRLSMSYPGLNLKIVIFNW